MRWHNVGPTPSLLFADVGPTSFCSLALLRPQRMVFQSFTTKGNIRIFIDNNSWKILREGEKCLNLKISDLFII